MEFTAIDFETANRNSTSICSVGLVKVSHGRIISSESHYIKPYPNFFEKGNVRVHGIVPSDVQDSPNFAQWYAQHHSIFDDAFFVAHNAAFDMGALRHVLDLYGIHYPDLRYACTFQLSRKLLPGLPGYGLSKLARYFDIKFKHHDAEHDAYACSVVFKKIQEAHQIESEDDLVSVSGNALKRIENTPLKGVKNKTKLPNHFLYIDTKAFAPEKQEIDQSHFFYGKHFVFSGNLRKLSRNEAMQEVVNLGGKVHPPNLSGKTDILVCGNFDSQRYGRPFISKKLSKAKQLIAGGSPLVILEEDEFLAHFD